VTDFVAGGFSMLGTFLSAASLTGDVLVFDVRGGRSPNDDWLPSLGRSDKELNKLPVPLNSGLESLSFSLKKFKN
jgi:hypothetical protein